MWPILNWILCMVSYRELSSFFCIYKPSLSASFLVISVISPYVLLGTLSTLIGLHRDYCLDWLCCFAGLCVSFIDNAALSHALKSGNTVFYCFFHLLPYFFCLLFFNCFGYSIWFIFNSMWILWLFLYFCEVNHWF